MFKSLLMSKRKTSTPSCSLYSDLLPYTTSTGVWFIPPPQLYIQAVWSQAARKTEHLNLLHANARGLHTNFSDIIHSHVNQNDIDVIVVVDVLFERFCSSKPRGYQRLHTIALKGQKTHFQRNRNMFL